MVQVVQAKKKEIVIHPTLSAHTYPYADLGADLGAGLSEAAGQPIFRSSIFLNDRPLKVIRSRTIQSALAKPRRS